MVGVVVMAVGEFLFINVGFMWKERGKKENFKPTTITELILRPGAAHQVTVGLLSHIGNGKKASFSSFDI